MVISLKKIMIIEDDLELAKSLSEFINKKGYDVCYLKEFGNGIEYVKKYQPSLILLDINLEEENGFIICKKIREEYKTPIIFITGRDSDKDEIQAITLGGDDYIRKPFSKEVLLVRIERILISRSYEYMNEIRISNLYLNISKNTITNIENQQSVELSNNEFQILYYLMLHKNEIVRREVLIDYLWDSKLYIDENALNVNISRLRKRLESIGLYDVIRTVRGEGLILC